MFSLPPEDFERLEKACAEHCAKNTETIRSFQDFRKSIPDIFRRSDPVEAEYQPWQYPMQSGERYAMKMIYEV